MFEEEFEDALLFLLGVEEPVAPWAEVEREKARKGNRDESGNYLVGPESLLGHRCEVAFGLVGPESLRDVGVKLLWPPCFLWVSCLDGSVRCSHSPPLLLHQSLTAQPRKRLNKTL